MDHNYMFLQNNLKTNLLAENGFWEFELAGKSWKLSDSMERLYVYLILVENDLTSVSANLRAHDRKISVTEIEEFYEYVKETHPTEKCVFDIMSLPTYAKPGAPLYLPNPFSYEVPLTVSQEQELLDILKQENDLRKLLLRQWFGRYIERYALMPRYKKDEKIQRSGLAISFCRQHGVNYEELIPKWEAEKRKKEAENSVNKQVQKQSYVGPIVSEDTGEAGLWTFIIIIVNTLIYWRVARWAFVDVHDLCWINEKITISNAIYAIIALVWNIMFGVYIIHDAYLSGKDFKESMAIVWGGTAANCTIPLLIYGVITLLFAGSVFAESTV